MVPIYIYSYRRYFYSKKEVMEKSTDDIEGRICCLGFKMLKIAGLHPQQKKPNLLITLLMFLPPIGCAAISCQQLVFGKKDLDSFVKNAEAFVVFLEVQKKLSIILYTIETNTHILLVFVICLPEKF